MTDLCDNRTLRESRVELVRMWSKRNVSAEQYVSENTDCPDINTCDKFVETRQWNESTHEGNRCVTRVKMGEPSVWSIRKNKPFNTYSTTFQVALFANPDRLPALILENLSHIHTFPCSVFIADETKTVRKSHHTLVVRPFAYDFRTQIINRSCDQLIIQITMPFAEASRKPKIN